MSQTPTGQSVEETFDQLIDNLVDGAIKTFGPLDPEKTADQNAADLMDKVFMRIEQRERAERFIAKNLTNIVQDALAED